MGKLKTSLIKYQKSIKKNNELLNQQCKSNRKVEDIVKKDNALKTETRLLLPFHIYPISPNREYISSLPVTPNSRVLLLGEGNFSYSVSLLNQVLSMNSDIEKLKKLYGFVFIATCHEKDLKELCEKYPEAKENIQEIERLGGKVYFNTDACEVYNDKRYKNTLFTRVIFNFPHLGMGIKDQSVNILKHQKFLKSVLDSIQSLFLAHFDDVKRKKASGTHSKDDMTKSTSYKTVQMSVVPSNLHKPSHCRTLVRKNPHNHDGYGDDSDTEGRKYFDACVTDDDDDDSDSMLEIPIFKEVPELHITLKVGEPYNSWNIKKLALANSSEDYKLHFQESYKFIKERFPTYQHVNTIGHYLPSYLKQQDDASCTETVGQDQSKKLENDHLEDKLCKTFVFSLTKNDHYKKKHS